MWRIGELARRVGVSTQLLRAWERRYGLFEPQRSPSGYRLYSATDERRARLVLALQADGHSTAEAARLALDASEVELEARAAASLPVAASAAGGTEAGELERIIARLRLSLDALDEPATQQTLDTLFALTDVETAIVRVILPVLNGLGEAWANDEISVAAEHYASNLLQARLLAIARGWNSGAGPLAVLACAPGELHAIGLIAFGLALRSRGWRIAYLGPSTPLDSLAGWAPAHRPEVVVISAVTPERLSEAEAGLRTLAASTRLFLGGAGATHAIAERVGATALIDDPSAAADELTQLVFVGDRGRDVSHGLLRPAGAIIARQAPAS
jgi:MerR family transcriptional regulator, light-induced transcriptional regulator